MSDSVIPWTAALQISLPFTTSWSLLKLMSIKSTMSSNHLILCRPLLFLPSIFPTIRGFSNELALHIRWPKYLSFSFSISPSNEYSGLISFRIDWFDHLAVQGTLKSLLQHQSSKASVLWCSTSFIVQLSLVYVTTGKTIALTIQTFVVKAMSLLFHTLSNFVTASIAQAGICYRKGIESAWYSEKNPGLAVKSLVQVRDPSFYLPVPVNKRFLNVLCGGVLSHVQLFVTLWTVACQAPLSMEWVAISYSRGSSEPRNWTHISCVFCICLDKLYCEDTYSTYLPYESIR